MKFNVLSLFPGMFEGFLNESIMKKAIENKLIEVNLINIRDYAFDKHKVVDDVPYGGGAGMLLKVEPLYKALENLKNTKIIYTSPQGRVFNQDLAKELAEEGKEITIIAGRYEGIDERIIEEFVDMEVSIGDYVLTGGELPAMVMIDSISRLKKGVIGNENSYEEDSFYNGLLDYPHYTRPAEFLGKKVPDVLLSGHHENIRKWRLKESIKRTFFRRPELLKKRKMTKEEEKIIIEIKKEIKNIQ